MLATFRNFFDALIFLHNEGLITYCHFNGSQVKGNTSKNQQAANSIQYVESYHTSNYSDLFKNLQLGEDSTNAQNMIFFSSPKQIVVSVSRQSVCSFSSVCTYTSKIFVDLFLINQEAINNKVSQN